MSGSIQIWAGALNYERSHSLAALQGAYDQLTLIMSALAPI